MRLSESQLETRARLDTELTEWAYAELGASVQPRRRVVSRPYDGVRDLDAAVCACLEYINVVPGKVPDGVTDLEERLEHLCRPSGTMRRLVRLDEGWSQCCFGALLARLDTGETVALIPSRVRGYQMLDATTGSRRRVTREVASHLEAEATLFYRPLPNKELGAEDLIRYMIASFDLGDYLRVVASAITVTLVGLLPSWVNNLAFGTVIPSGSLEFVIPITCLLVGVVTSKVLVGACRNFVMARLSTKLSVTCEAATFARVLVLPSSFFREYESGDIAMRVSQVRGLTEGVLSLLLGSGLTVLLSFIYLMQIWTYTPMLALPAFVITVVQILLSLAIVLSNARYERAAMEANAKLSGNVTALLNGVQKIKLAGAERRAFSRWARGYAAYARFAYNRPFIVKALPSVILLMGAVGCAAIYIMAGTANVSVADYMSFNVAFGMMTAAVTGIMSMTDQVARIAPMVETVKPIFAAVPEVADNKPMVGTLSGSIEVSGITFRYHKGAPYVMRDLSFSVRSGEYVAIVGRSGCGKSTLVRLLLGFERPERGSIFYGSYDVSKVDLRSLRRSIGTVMQDSTLFMGEIMSNITISMPMATPDDAWEAAEIAGIADDIRKMPMGMHTMITAGGGGVSGGQRQRIMIARAVCGHRNILILDEATSALDNVTQQQVTDALARLGCTRLVVAHRLSTVRHCDRILVIDDGHIVEEGTYDELIARDGVFAELVSRQQLEEA